MARAAQLFNGFDDQVAEMDASPQNEERYK